MNATAPNDEASSAPPRTGETVLMVEDDPRVRRATFDRLTALGYRVLQAGDGATAVQVLHECPQVELLFSDVALPGGMSGLDLARRARELYPKLCIVLTTGYSAELLNGDGEVLDVEVLRKPYRQADLVRVLREALRRR